MPSLSSQCKQSTWIGVRAALNSLLPRTNCAAISSNDITKLFWFPEKTTSLLVFFMPFHPCLSCYTDAIALALIFILLLPGCGFCPEEHQSHPSSLPLPTLLALCLSRCPVLLRATTCLQASPLTHQLSWVCSRMKVTCKAWGLIVGY